MVDERMGERGWTCGPAGHGRPLALKRSLAPTSPGCVRVDERTDGRTDDQDGRGLTKRRAGKAKTTIPETILFLCFL